MGEALERTKTLLFRPFSLEKWFIIGFCAWLAGLAQEGVRGGYYNVNNKEVFNKSQIPAQTVDFLKTNIIFIACAAAAAVILFVAIVLILLWLSSRGKFMFLDCLAKNKAHIKEPWKTFKKQANSLLGLRLLIIAAAFLCITPLATATIFLFAFFSAGNVNAVIAGIVFFIMLLLIFLAASILGLVQSLTFDFVMPIMYLQRISAFAAWNKFLPLLWQNFWKIMLYMVFKIVVIFCIGAIALSVIVISCCCCCVGMVIFIPYIGTVVLLPLSSFYRLYTLCYFRQFGSEYDVFQTTT